jgi:D-alanyl-D-alanine carboxypeptidase
MDDRVKARAGDRRSGRWMAGAIAAVLALGVFTSGASGFTHAQRQAFAAAARHEMVRDGYPGLIVGVWQHGHGRFVTALGEARHDPSVPMTAETPLRIGSVTKTLTATVILRLAQAGKLSLRDRLSDWYPRIPYSHAIRIRNLLDHTSGIQDLAPSVAEAVFTRPHRHWSPHQVIHRTTALAPACAPGRCWLYSNTGYIILGRIAERVTHKPLTRLYRRYVTGPLRLHDTVFRPNSRVPPGMGHGYVEPQPGTVFDTTHWSFSWAFSAGGFISTLDDLKVYSRHLATGRGLLSRRMQRKRMTPVPTKLTGLGLRYGLGIARFGSYWGHNGIVPGYEDMVVHSPRRKTTIVVLGNTSPAQDIFNTGQPPDPFLFRMLRSLKRIVRDGG